MGRILLVGFIVISSVIIHYFYIDSITVLKTKTQTPLVINADAPLPLAISVQSFQPIAGWRTKVFNSIRIIQHLQFAFGSICKCSELAWAFTFKERFRVFATEGFDHVE